MQPYNREKVAAALDTIPEKGSGPTPLKIGLEKLEGILKPLSGRTAVFVFWDGEYTGQNPAEIAKRLAKKYDACFYVISSAKPKREATLAEDVATLNACSRVIPLADFINRPDYTSGALFDVKVTEQVVTTTDNKIVGLKVDDINFATNETDARRQGQGRAGQAGRVHEGQAQVLCRHRRVYRQRRKQGPQRGPLASLAPRWSRRYLKEKHGIDDSRMVLFWYGPNNPIVANDTPENQAKNRRVEVNVGLGE